MFHLVEHIFFCLARPRCPPASPEQTRIHTHTTHRVVEQRKNRQTGKATKIVNWAAINGFISEIYLFSMRSAEKKTMNKNDNTNIGKNIHIQDYSCTASTWIYKIMYKQNIRQYKFLIFWWWSSIMKQASSASPPVSFTRIHFVWIYPNL